MPIALNLSKPVMLLLAGAWVLGGCVQGGVDSTHLYTGPGASPTPGSSASPAPTPTPTSVAPTPTPTPTHSPSPMPSLSPSPMPSLCPTPMPTPTPTVVYPSGAVPVPGSIILPGLRARVWLRGGDRSQTGAPGLMAISNEMSWAASNSPNFTFLDQSVNSNINVVLNGSDNSPIASFLAPDAQGPITQSVLTLQTGLVDWSGYVHIPVAGNYLFSIYAADDAAAVYLYGDYGSSGSGVVATINNYQSNVSANGSVNGNATINFASDGNYTFELFWFNQTIGGNGGASLKFTIAGPAPVTFYTLDAVDETIAASAQLPSMTLGVAQRLTIPTLSDTGVYNYANDSVFPWLPSMNDPNTMLMFFVDGSVYRTVSPNLWTLPPPVPTNPVLQAGGPGFDANGVWLLNAVRNANNILVGLYHAEDHNFASGSGEWSTAGVALSADDGNSWTKLGQVVGIPKPSVGAFGGREVTCMLWDPNTARWMGIGHGLGFVSSDPNAAPGTWFGYHNGRFDQQEPDTAGTNTEDVLPGLTSNMAECKLHYNTYLNKFLLLWRAWGGTSLNLSVSQDAVTWGGTVTFYNSGDPNLFVEYSQLMGPSDVAHGQDTWFVYEQRPSTQGRFRDMVVRALHFN